MKDFDDKSPREKNFFGTLLAICSGTEIFANIAKQAFSKTLLHFFLISLLSSLAYISFKTPSLLQISYSYCEALATCFGGVDCGPIIGLKPLKEENKARKIKIGKTRIDYIPDRNFDYKMENDDSAKFGVIWFPDSLYFWTKNDDLYKFSPVTGGIRYIWKNRGVSSKLSDVLNAAKKNPFNPDIISSETINFGDCKFTTFVVLIIIYFMAMLFLNIIIPTLFYSLMFFCVFAIFGGGLLKYMKPLNFLSVIICASFPGIIIASIYKILELPFFSFEMVCLACFSVYMIFVVKSLQKHFEPKTEDTEAYDDDDDFF